MASFSQNQFQQFHQQQPQQSKPFSDLYNNSMEGQIPQPVVYFNTPNLLDNHPPYIPPFQVAGLAPVPVREEDGLDLQWNFGLALKKTTPTEQVFLENNFNSSSNNNSQISSAELLHPLSVSTGLGLSLENPLLTSSGDSTVIGLGCDSIEQELRRQDADIDRYVKLQGDRLRQAVLEKFQAAQLQTISYVEEKVMQKIREKDAEVEGINKKNLELELRVDRLSMEANAWQQRAKHIENMISSLKLNLQQVCAQARDSKEGCGDSEVEDTASCCNGRPADLPLCTNRNPMACKACGVKRVCMLLFPCKHLCLCKECESKLSICPLCQSWKYTGMEVYM